jgi:phosphatidate cytidylyltransferase
MAGLDLAPMLVLVALALSAASQAGDLLESAIKRQFGAKDASQIIPGHGGLMDRLDGFLTAVLAAVMVGVAHGGLDGAAQGLLVWK